ncbi:phosphoribosylglycinamide synthetase [Schizophyllum fasciatum]
MSDAQGNKKKRACDYCRSKRVICHPQPDGESCPRCLEKGVQCTTTILTTRKPRGQGKKALAKQAALRKKDAEAEATSALALRQAHSCIPPAFPDGAFPIPGDLIRDAIDVMLEMAPGGSPGLFPLQRQRALMESCGWDIRAVALQDRVLVLCLVATAALVSVNSTYVGLDQQGGRFSDAHLHWETKSSARLGTPEMRELGRRRKTICAQLYGEAVRQATLDNTGASPSRENVTSCSLLNVLDVTYNRDSALPWATAFVWQMRTMVEHNLVDDVFEIEDSPAGRALAIFQWRVALLLLVSVYAMSAAKSLPFAPHDEALICGPAPPPVEDAFSEALSCTGPTVVIQLMQSVTSCSIRLMRDALDTIVGAYARRHPPDDLTVLRQLAAAEQHHGHLTRLRRFLLARVANNPGRQVLLHIAMVAFCVHTVALYRALHMRANDAGGAMPLAVQLVMRARVLAVRAVIDAAAELRSVVVQHWLVLTQRCGFEAWAQVLLDDEKLGDSSQALENDLTASIEERIDALEQLRECIFFTAFIGFERTEIIPLIDTALDSLRTRLAHHASSSALVAFTPPSSGPSTGSWTSDLAPATPSLQQPAFWTPPAQWDAPTDDWMPHLVGPLGLTQLGDGHTGNTFDYEVLQNMSMLAENMDPFPRHNWT